MKHWIDMTSLRLSRRSPSVPAIGAIIRPGRRLTPPTVTTKNVEYAECSVRLRTSQPIVSSCNHCALLEKKLPIHR